jgi:hypothetical protein
VDRSKCDFQEYRHGFAKAPNPVPSVSHLKIMF